MILDLVAHLYHSITTSTKLKLKNLIRLQVCQLSRYILVLDFLIHHKCTNNSLIKTKSIITNLSVHTRLIFLSRPKLQSQLKKFPNKILLEKSHEPLLEWILILLVKKSYVLILNSSRVIWIWLCVQNRGSMISTCVLIQIHVVIISGSSLV